MATVKMNPSFKSEMGRPENSRPWQREAGIEGRIAIQNLAPVKFGTLAGTLYVRSEYTDGTTYVYFASTRPYAGFQEYGTGLYGPLKKYITPKRAKFLKWADSTSGDVHYAKRVKGTPAVLYMFKGLDLVFGNATSYASTGGKSS